LLDEALERALRDVPLLADDVVRRRELPAPRELVPARAEVRRPLDRLLEADRLVEPERRPEVERLLEVERRPDVERLREVARRADVRLLPAPLRCEAGISA
jgi:hypothetical protein